MIHSIPIGAKIGVSELLYTHTGVNLGNGQVFHNHWRNGAEIITADQFSNGKKIMVLSDGCKDLVSLHHRMRELLTARRPYDAFLFNCEHAASYVCDGVASSPQLKAFGIALGIGGIIMLASGSLRPAR